MSRVRAEIIVAARTEAQNVFEKKARELAKY